MDKLISQIPKVIIKKYDKYNSFHKRKTSIYLPRGLKYIAWFTFYNNQPICLFVEIKYDKIIKYEHYYVSFNQELSIGTIIYGTMVTLNRKRTFICEDIFMYKNEYVNYSIFKKINKIKNIIQHYINDSTYLNTISFKLPFITNEFDILKCSNLSYKVYNVLQINNNEMVNVVPLYVLNAVFQIRKSDKLDVYNLYIMKNNKIEYYSKGLVNDFKTSVLLKKQLNSHSRNYHEIELSDDEDEDKGKCDECVKYINVECIYIYTLKKWKPYILSSKCVDTIEKVTRIENKNINI